MRCSWCGAEQPDGLLMHLTHHPDRPTVCVDERGCSNREMAQYRRRIATAEERLAVAPKTKGPERTAVVEQNGAPRPHHSYSSTMRSEFHIRWGRANILTAALAAREAVGYLDEVKGQVDRTLEHLQHALHISEQLGIEDTTPLEDALAESEKLQASLKGVTEQALEVNSLAEELVGEARQAERAEVA